MTGRWADLAAAVRRRRSQLRLPQDLTTSGGPGEMTVRKIERGEPTAIRNRTKTQLERALQWPTGHIDRVLAGTACSGEHSATPEPLSLADDDARALRVGRLVLALLHELSATCTGGRGPR